MASVYTPSPIRQQSMMLVSDGDEFAAAGINTPIEAIADGVEYLNQHMDDAEADVDAIHARAELAAVLNWRKATVTGVGSTSSAFYNAPGRAWVAVGPTETVKSSLDGGISWSASSLVASVGANEDCLNGDYDASGNMVVATSTRYVFEGTNSTGTWTKVDVLALDPGLAITSTRVVYDPIHSRWVWFSAHVNLLAVKHSSDRTTWTSGTAPSGTGSWGDDDHELLRLACNRGTGRIVAIAKCSSLGTFAVATSDDGGATWTVRASIPGVSGATTASLVYDATDDEWIFAQGETSGTPTSTVYRSTDGGVTWSLRSTLTTACVYSVATLRGLWVGMALVSSSHRLVWSSDKGTTWNYAGFGPGAATGGIYGGDGDFTIPISGEMFTSHRVGTPSLGTLT